MGVELDIELLADKASSATRPSFNMWSVSVGEGSSSGSDSTALIILKQSLVSRYVAIEI